MELVKVCTEPQFKGRTAIRQFSPITLTYKSHNLVHHDNDISPLLPPHLPSSVEYSGIFMTPRLPIPPLPSSISRPTSLGRRNPLNNLSIRRLRLYHNLIIIYHRHFLTVMDTTQSYTIAFEANREALPPIILTLSKRKNRL